MQFKKSLDNRFREFVKVTEVTLLAAIGSTVCYCLWFPNVGLGTFVA